MATIGTVAESIRKLSQGLRPEVGTCMGENTAIMADMVREQIYSGLRGDGEFLSPSYLDDPYFNEDGPWKGRARDYMHWKKIITPPEQSLMLMLPARPESIPNLFITGPFHESIKGKGTEDGVTIYTSGFRDGPSIERKYGAQIFGLTDTAKEHFIRTILRPRMERFYKQCGINL